MPRMVPEALKSPRRSFYTRLRWCPKSRLLKLMSCLSCATFCTRCLSVPNCHPTNLCWLVFNELSQTGKVRYSDFVEITPEQYMKQVKIWYWLPGSWLLHFGTKGDKEVDGGEGSVDPRGEEQPDGNPWIGLQVCNLLVQAVGLCKLLAPHIDVRFALGSVAGAAGATAVYPIDLVWKITNSSDFILRLECCGMVGHRWRQECRIRGRAAILGSWCTGTALTVSRRWLPICVRGKDKGEVLLLAGGSPRGFYRLVPRPCATTNGSCPRESHQAHNERSR